MWGFGPPFSKMQAKFGFFCRRLLARVPSLFTELALTAFLCLLMLSLAIRCRELPLLQPLFILTSSPRKQTLSLT